MSNQPRSLFEFARKGVEAAQRRVEQFEKSGGLEGAARRAAEALREHEQRINAGQHPLNPHYQQQVLVWFRRLELEPGASAEQVRTQFRTLMRRYHPDRHVGDVRAEELATRISQELTVAYEGLIQHLNR